MVVVAAILATFGLSSGFAQLALTLSDASCVREASVILAGSLLPPRLRDLAKPPSALYVRGELPRGPIVGIVGTRQATPEGFEFTARLAGELASAGIAVISGGAVGIDTAAHEGALAAGGVTVVMAPSGFDKPYPPENAQLFARVVAEGGAYASLLPDDKACSRGSFFRRNACLVALAHALVLVEAGYRSGARNAVARARELGRPLLVVPQSPWHPRASGCLHELRRGARLCERSEDVIEVLTELGCQLLGTGAAGTGPAADPQLNLFSAALAPSDGDDSSINEKDELTRVHVAALRVGQDLDKIVQLTGLSVPYVQQALLTLCLQGVLVPGPGGQLSISKSSD